MLALQEIHIDCVEMASDYQKAFIIFYYYYVFRWWIMLIYILIQEEKECVSVATENQELDISFAGKFEVTGADPAASYKVLCSFCFIFIYYFMLSFDVWVAEPYVFIFFF